MNAWTPRSAIAYGVPQVRWWETRESESSLGRRESQSTAPFSHLNTRGKKMKKRSNEIWKSMWQRGHLDLGSDVSFLIHLLNRDEYGLMWCLSWVTQTSSSKYVTTAVTGRQIFPERQTHENRRLSTQHLSTLSTFAQTYRRLRDNRGGSFKGPVCKIYWHLVVKWQIANSLLPATFSKLAGEPKSLTYDWLLYNSKCSLPDSSVRQGPRIKLHFLYEHRRHNSYLIDTFMKGGLDTVWGRCYCQW